MSSDHSENALHQPLIQKIESVLEKINFTDTKIKDLRRELEEMSETLFQSGMELEQTKNEFQKLSAEQMEAEKMRTNVSDTIENLFAQMTQVVNSARENLSNKPVQAGIVTPVAAPPNPKENLVVAPEVSNGEVHETLLEVARTLVREDAEMVVQERKAEDMVKSPLAEISELLSKATHDVTKDILGDQPDQEPSLMNELPPLLKETLQQTESLSEMEMDLGAEDSDADEELDPEETDELLKKISSSYVAGSPE